MINLEFNEKNWKSLLECLQYTEQKNPNGVDCYDIYDENGIPKWQYSGQGEKELYYYFFMGQRSVELSRR